jgi:hypothetical protein
VLKFILIIAALAGLYYVYHYLNEKHVEEVMKKRAAEVKQADPLEFNRSLYKVRAARQRLREQLPAAGKEQIELKFNSPKAPEPEKKIEEIKELKKEEPSIPAPPDDPSVYINDDQQQVPESDNNQDQGGYQ